MDAVWPRSIAIEMAHRIATMSVSLIRIRLKRENVGADVPTEIPTAMVHTIVTTYALTMRTRLFRANVGVALPM